MEKEFIGLMFLRLQLMKGELEAKKRKKICRRWKVRPINQDWARGAYFAKVFMRIRNEDEEQFFIHTRMNKNIYNLLLTLIGNALSKPKQSIRTEERISMTLLFLAHGKSIQCIAWSYKVGKTTVREIILETSKLIWDVLSPTYLTEPTQSQYVDIERDFAQMWNLPNCVGAIDGKHIAIKCPSNAGSSFFNYKKFHSVVLMAVCDAKYTFTAVSVGAYGSESDGGVLRGSSFGKALLENQLPLPANKPLPGTTQQFPHFFVGDAAFPQGQHLMKPLSPSRNGGNMLPKERAYNYRISRARRTIENAFGILVARWRILGKTMEFAPENCEKIVLACLALHKFVMLNDTNRWYCPQTFVDTDGANNLVNPGEWRDEVEQNLRPYSSHSRRTSGRVLELREVLINYLSGEGTVSFQNNI